MTQEQKDKILGFRQEGMSYTKIAQLMDISVNTIKSFCQRIISTEKPKKPAETTKISMRTIDSGHHCRQCGAHLSQIPGHREKKFCSTSCRMKWWGSHGAEMRHSNPNLCRHCGKPFYGRSGRKYCSHSCYIAERFGDSHAS